MNDREFNNNVYVNNSGQEGTTALAKAPSIKVAILMLLLFLFAISPIARWGIFLAKLAGLSFEKNDIDLSYFILMCHICMTVALISYMLKSYSNFLLSYSWKTEFVKLTLVGLKWGMPLIAIQLFVLGIPIFREKIVDQIFSVRILSVEGISNLTLLLYSVWVISCSIFEEFIFRGVFLQRMALHLNKNLSIFLIAVVFSFSHLSFLDVHFRFSFHTFLVGLCCGFAYAQTSSCISAIIPHLLNNVVYIGVVSCIK